MINLNGTVGGTHKQSKKWPVVRPASSLKYITSFKETVPISRASCVVGPPVKDRVSQTKHVAGVTKDTKLYLNNRARLILLGEKKQ